MPEVLETKESCGKDVILQPRPKKLNIFCSAFFLTITMYKQKRELSPPF